MKKLILVLAILLIALTSCKKAEDVKEVKFNSADSSVALKEYSNKTVKINGFLAAVDTDSTTGYLVPKPYSTHIDFDENKSEILDCLMFIMPEKTSYTVTDLPVTVEGTLVFEEYTDAMGYTSYISIKNAKVTNYVAEKESSLYAYSNLASTNFIDLFDTYMSTIYSTTNYLELEEDPEAVDSDLFGDLYAMVDNHPEESYATPKQLIIDGMSLVVDINETLAAGDLDSLTELNTRGQTLYDSFYTWLHSISF